MTPAPTTEAQALREALAFTIHASEVSNRFAGETADALLAGPLAKTLADKAVAEADLAAARAEIDRLRAALTLLLPFVDFAAGEGLELVPDPDDAGSWMDAADLCVAAAKALGHECGDPDYVALLVAGREAIRSALVLGPQEGTR